MECEQRKVEGCDVPGPECVALQSYDQASDEAHALLSEIAGVHAEDPDQFRVVCMRLYTIGGKWYSWLYRSR